jgi:NAD(P)-dependent dehydrogenase (short-subunit alcohol dehydrogenase family)
VRLSGITAVVTGGAGAFGGAIATRYAAQGATVVLTDQDGDRLAAAAATVPGVTPVVADLTEPAEVAGLFAAVDRVGPVDVLVNAAGCIVRSPLRFHTDAAWQRVLRVNLDSVFYCSRMAIQRMLPRRRGRVVNLSSVLGITGGADEIAYATAKAGVIGFTRSLAQEVGRYGICVNAICPTMAAGGVSDEYFSGLHAEPAAVAAVLARRARMPRPIEPGDVADVALFLATPESSYVNGQAVQLGGAAG